MNAATRKRYRLYIRLRLWSRRVGLGRILAFFLTALAVASGIGTLVTMTGASDEGSDSNTVITLLYLDVILMLLLVFVIVRRLIGLWTERRRRQAGSGLHARIALLFSLVAAAPAVLVAVFAALFLNFGIQAWFSERVSTAITESNAVATAYLEEHRKTIRADILGMAKDLNREASNLMRNRWILNRVLTTQAALRSLPEAMIIDGGGKVLAKSDFSFTLQFDSVPHGALQSAAGGDVVLVTTETGDRVRAVLQLEQFVDAFLVVGRVIDPQVVEHIERTRGAVAHYKRVERQRESYQITFVMIFVVVAILLLLAAVWIGLTFANQLVKPISGLISAADRVRRGDLGVRVDTRSATDEIQHLSRAFNRMTSQLETQRLGLVQANQELDERRRFTETVLEGVTAGVIGLDSQGNIHLANRSAALFLDTDLDKAVGEPLGQVVPELSSLFEEVEARPDRLHQSEVHLQRRNRPMILHVRMVAESIADTIIGFVMTFDDITELQSAQRKAAWADVARRIAHEIKNPLTPIQLSAERLKRKYLGDISNDPDTFKTCIDTIVRQVGDIRRMVDEFSAFARMPQPSFKAENISEVCAQVLFLERTRTPRITFDSAFPEKPVRFHCDGQLISRALTNVLKNAAESVSSHFEDDGGRIDLRLTETLAETERVVTITVDDNGGGFPATLKDRLTEPYVTSREKGTGLGLAIVKKIVEDHGGELLLEDRDEGGARVVMIFRGLPLDESGDSGEPEIDPMTIATGLPLHGA